MLNRMLTRTIPLTAVLLATAAAFAAEPKAERAVYNDFSDQEEAIIGRTLVKRFESRNRIIRNPIAEAYLENIASQLASASQRPDVEYDVRVIVSDQVNAFSLPGGHIYVTLGLLGFVDTEGELVAAMSHEVGHVVGRHTLNRIARFSAVQSLVQQARSRNVVMTSEMADRIAGAGISIVYTLFERSFNRDEEREADLFGFYQMGRAQWHPQAMISLFEHIQRGSARYGPADKILATHPEPGERASRLRDEMTEVLLPRNMRQDSLEFQVLKRGLSLLR